MKWKRERRGEERERGGEGRGGGELQLGSTELHGPTQSVECRGFESSSRQLTYIWKSDCLGCVVLLCLVVCLTVLASFFLLSHLPLKHVYTCIMYMYTYMYMYVCMYCTCIKFFMYMYKIYYIYTCT